MFVALFMLAAVFSQSSLALAQNDATNSGTTVASTAPLNLTMSPIAIEIEAEPGKSTTSSFRLRNNGTEKETLQFSLLPFEADSDGDSPRLREVSSEDDYIQWVTFKESSVALAPGEWKTIDFTFFPPSDASLSYYFAIRISRNTESKKPGEAVIAGSPAILVLATVDSPLSKRELKLESFGVKFPILEFMPQEIVFTIQNSGNVHVRPSGTIFIDGQGKKDISVIPINPNNSSVLPQTNRSFLVPWSDGFPKMVVDPKTNTRRLELDWSKANLFRFGRFTAHMIMVYDNGERDVPIESSVSFWIIPFRLILLVFGVLVMPALLVYLWMRWQMRRKAKY